MTARALPSVPSSPTPRPGCARPGSTRPSRTRGCCWPTCCGSNRARLPLLDGLDDDAAAGLRRADHDAGAARVPLQHLTGRGALPPSRAGGRTRRLRAAAGDRGDDRLGDRRAASDDRRTAAGRCVVDLCAGSGAIAKALATELTGSRCTRSSVSPEAAAYAAGTSPTPGRAATSATWPTRCTSWTGPSTWSSPTRPTSRSRPTPRSRPRRVITIRSRRCSPGADGLDAIRRWSPGRGPAAADPVVCSASSTPTCRASRRPAVVRGRRGRSPAYATIAT